MDAEDFCEGTENIKCDNEISSASNALSESVLNGERHNPTNMTEGKASQNVDEKSLLTSVDESCNYSLKENNREELSLPEVPMECNMGADLLVEAGNNDENELEEGSKALSNENNLEISEMEEDRLLSDISMMVDDTSTVDVKFNDYTNSKDGEINNDEVENKDLDPNKIDEDNLMDDNVSANCDDYNEDSKAEAMINRKTIDENEEISPEESVNAEKRLSGTVNDENEIKKSQSAFKRLASLGVIAEEKPIIETKESILMKLASRGAISITPAGGVGLPSISSSISITPTKAKIKTDSTPVKQKPKKIKIDPGKSLDIDKDFNNLISFLCRASDEPSTKSHSEVISQHKKPTKPIENVTDNILTITKETPKSNDCDISKNLQRVTDCKNIESEANEDLEASIPLKMEVELGDEQSKRHEADYSENHEDSKSISHTSDQTEENDEKEPGANKQKNVIEEGSAEILIFGNNVFYNQVQEFNRDISIAALTVFSEMHQKDPRTRNRGKKRKAGTDGENHENGTENEEENVFEPGKKSENGITILEALSATGLRSIRYAREIPGLKQVIANDLNPVAVECIEKNVEYNGVQDLVTASQSDAALLMYQKQAAQEWYDAIDLDPYGGPAPFLDSAVKGVRDGGLLLVTCTDMAILAGNSPETCHARYGAISLRGPACHEMAIRIILQCIESHANRHGRYIVPLLSFHVDFYLRVIVQIYTSPVTCKKTTSKLSWVYQCCGCSTFTLHPLGSVSSAGGPNSQPKFSLVQGPPVNATCFHCYHKHFVGGPIWSAPIYCTKFVERMLTVVENGRFATCKRMQGMLEVIREELPDVPLHYSIAGLCTKLHCQAIPLIDIRSAILNAGYRVSSSHTSATSIKTNAPSKVVWDIMRCWVHMNPVNQKRLIPGSVAAAIIMEPPLLIANFDIHPKARPSSSMRKLLRYQQNPQKNWGPGTRSRLNTSVVAIEDKRKANQNKNKNKKNIDIIEVVTIDDEDETTEEVAVAAPTSTPTSVPSISEPTPTTSTSST